LQFPLTLPLSPEGRGRGYKIYEEVLIEVLPRRYF